MAQQALLLMLPPADMVGFFPIIYRVSYMLGGGDRRISEPSTVVKITNQP